MMRLALIGLLILCVAPAPGSVEGCGSDNAPADAVDFCLQTEAWNCRRAEARGEIPGEMHSDVQSCVDALPDSCAGRSWSPDRCPLPPTSFEAQACIDELAKAANVDVEMEAIPACMGLCDRGME